ncbi:methyl-accepting chemotaxis protein [Rhizobium sp. SG_E_25_P2]|uniref:methyl-accepting chemotaxis protein n=1 Tax=Rhizobium sp. SG_E_25_P2 TaxID=2879942 RepID=UPI002475AA79|nr:methyl-accepting chemotaxis protein [Rhizobium sp. SG_E_25_P2]MDH6266785.1 methyl-accepting chemotaxis protein [Rhizobium sp. SG_E_25_P2]
MKFTSIQQKIALLSGLCVIAATGGVVAYNMATTTRSQAFVAERVGRLTEDLTKDKLKTIASAQAGAIEATLNGAFDAARTMARGFEALATPEAAGGIPEPLRRARFNDILLHVLKDNTGFNGTYSAWEPNALDGRDADFVDKRDTGSDATGRFLPYWTRDAGGKIALQPLVEYDSRDLHPNGVMKGGWYIGPQEGKGESILDPLPYIVQGKNVFLATMSAPITIDGAFKGVVGADFDLAFVQKLAEKVQASLYGGKVSVEIISHMGLIVASSERPDAIGRPFDENRPDLADALKTAESGENSVKLDADAFRAFAPIQIGRTKTPWSVMISVPKPVALAEAMALDAELAARNSHDTLMQAIVSAVIVITGMLGMWLVARSISSPIRRMTSTMRRLADGDTSADIPGTDRADEIGKMAETVAVFRSNAIEKARIEQEAETNRSLTEQERMAREAQKARETADNQFVVDQLADGLAKLAEGDVVYRLDTPFVPHLDSLRHDFNNSVGRLQAALQNVAENARAIDGGANEIRSAADDLSRRTEQQASSLEETAAALEEITTTVKDSARRAEEAGALVSRTRQGAEKAGDIVRSAVAAMKHIEKSSAEISNIIGVIDEIAFQTNLLALNAGVEAARAGEAGKGFAVVASEVRELAQRSAQAAKEIKSLIMTSGDQVRNGVALVDNTGRSLEAIVDEVKQINRLVEAIVESSREQSNGIQEINGAVNLMDQSTQQNAAMVEQSTAASHNLAKEAAALNALIGQFRIEANAAARRTEAAPAPSASSPARRLGRKIAAAFGGQQTAASWEEF